MQLLAQRDAGATICPSEVARLLGATAVNGASADWRTAMPRVHQAIDGLLAEGAVALSWKGKRLLARNGPYRIAASPAASIEREEY